MVYRLAGNILDLDVDATNGRAGRSCRRPCRTSGCGAKGGEGTSKCVQSVPKCVQGSKGVQDCPSVSKIVQAYPSMSKYVQVCPSMSK